MIMSSASRRTWCFNSRTREGCDLLCFHHGKEFQFQFTHPRGVRCVFRVQDLGYHVSIHAPARGAITRIKLKTTFNCFNSRTREGCDKFVDQLRNLVLVSIHAPARGAM